MFSKNLEDPTPTQDRRPGQPIRLTTIASDLAMAAKLAQNHKGKWHPISFFQRKFTEAPKGITQPMKKNYRQFTMQSGASNITWKRDHSMCTLIKNYHIRHNGKSREVTASGTL